MPPEHPSSEPEGQTTLFENGPPRHVNNGMLITFEGGEGSGKSYHSRRLAQTLRNMNYTVEHSFEPGGTALGMAIRRVIMAKSSKSAKNPSPKLTPMAEALLFAAARAELCKEVIRPTLQQGNIVILDRFIDSTIAYQGHGRGVPTKLLHTINDIATDGLQPDLTFLMLPAHDPLENLRIEQANLDATANTSSLLDRPDNMARFEQMAPAFHQRVLNGYKKLATTSSRWVSITLKDDPDETADLVCNCVTKLLST